MGKEVLSKINVCVNEAVTYRHDDNGDWRLPLDGHGDCEDYALQKRKHLRGFYPAFAAAFRIALVTSETGQGHAVLTVHTFDGVYVLDNRYLHVQAWKAPPYKWHRLEQPGKSQWLLIKN